MTPAQRNALIARAKRLAIPVTSCVAASLRPDHLLAARTRAELLALVVVLAEAADPVKLKAVTEAPGDTGLPPMSREDMLRAAHAEYSRLLRAGEPVPARLRLLNSEYRRGNKLRRTEAGDEQQRQGEAA